jgi:hypothetical protein
MLLFNLFKQQQIRRNTIFIVSGLPRSGTSMLMQILEAGGIEPVTDNRRSADGDNLKGYYEHEAVKALSKGHYDCLANAQGRALKVVSTLLKHLPDSYHYTIVFMHRDIDEILASQSKMLNNLNRSDDVNKDHQLKQLYINHLSNISKWVEQQKNMAVLHLHYDQLLHHPEQQMTSIMNFLSHRRNAKQMIAVIDKNMRHHANVVR